MKLKVWFLETRPHFLLLSVVLIFLGTTIANYDGFFNLSSSLLAFLGLLLLHISTNVLNDYYDYKSGIDRVTRRTPFSGGSGLLSAGILEPAPVFHFGIICFLLAVPVGIYFVLITNWQLLPILIVGAIFTLFYTPCLTRLPWPELMAGLGLGTLPVLGAYFVQGEAYTLPAVVAAVPSGILVHNLLFLNEFPDTEADKQAGRKTLPITLGKTKASQLYSLLTIIVYLWIIGGVITGFLPPTTLIALLTIPLAIKAIRGALNYDRESRLMPALEANVLVTLLTQLLLGIGYIVAKVM